MLNLQQCEKPCCSVDERTRSPLDSEPRRGLRLAGPAQASLDTTLGEAEEPVAIARSLFDNLRHKRFMCFG